MAFVEPITVRDAIENVHKKNYLLPAIQREFVWETKQIERLFDSLMRDYPISSFLFWEVEKKNIGKYQFYEFIRNYHERDRRCYPKANVKGESGITAILDGQQRLMAPYIGLKGSYSFKLPRKRKDDRSAYPERKLCLNLVSPSDDGDFVFDFRFLTNNEQQKSDDSHFWFRVGDILGLERYADINSYLINEGLLKRDEEAAKFSNETLFKLWTVIHNDKTINCFLEKGESLDKVLNIFIRVNSGGTKLSYSDLLLSIATAQWKEKDARKEITEFVDEINAVGLGFDADKDFVLKNCLVLGGFKDIAFKVDNFNRDNMLAIEKKWDDISKSIKASFVLLSSFGYHRDTVTSYNALIPIAAYLNKIGSPANFSESSQYKEDRKRLFRYLVIVTLKRTFGGQPDNVLRPIREVIDSSGDGFPFDGIVKELKGSTKALSFDDDDISSLLDYQYAKSYTYSILAILYPSLNFRGKFHQDHIFPKRLFTRSRLAKRGIADDKIDFYMDNYNALANLQLLGGIQNEEKAGKEFVDWIEDEFQDEDEKKVYMKTHYIPDVNLSLEDFEEFIEKRGKFIVAAFRKMIA